MKQSPSLSSLSYAPQRAGGNDVTFNEIRT